MGQLLGELVIPGTHFKAGSPSAAVTDGELLFARYRNTLVCVSLDTRTICWQNSRLPRTHFCSIATFAGHLLVCFGESLSLIAKTDGQVVWTKDVSFGSTAYEKRVRGMLTCVKADEKTAVLAGLHCVLCIEPLTGQTIGSCSLGEIPTKHFCLSTVAKVIMWPAVSNAVTNQGRSDNHATTMRGALVRMRFDKFTQSNIAV